MSDDEYDFNFLTEGVLSSSVSKLKLDDGSERGLYVLHFIQQRFSGDMVNRESKFNAFSKDDMTDNILDYLSLPRARIDLSFRRYRPTSCSRTHINNRHDDVLLFFHRMSYYVTVEVMENKAREIYREYETWCFYNDVEQSLVSETTDLFIHLYALYKGISVVFILDDDDMLTRAFKSNATNYEPNLKKGAIKLCNKYTKGCPYCQSKKKTKKEEKKLSRFSYFFFTDNYEMEKLQAPTRAKPILYYLVIEDGTLKFKADIGCFNSLHEFKANPMEEIEEKLNVPDYSSE